MDNDAINKILSNINADYDISDVDDVTQLIVDLINTFDKEEFEFAVQQIKEIG